jgi:hypothetical protein
MNLESYDIKLKNRGVFRNNFYISSKDPENKKGYYTPTILLGPVTFNKNETLQDIPTDSYNVTFKDLKDDDFLKEKITNFYNYLKLNPEKRKNGYTYTNYSSDYLKEKKPNTSPETETNTIAETETITSPTWRYTTSAGGKKSKKSKKTKRSSKKQRKTRKHKK